MASRPHAFIDGSVAWLVPALDLAAGSRVLDLGCGPGLYAERLARRGIEVLGIDVSSGSIAHARATSARDGLPARFREGSYLDCDLGSDHDAALLIYEDYCTLSPEQRELLLTRVRAALCPGGRFLFDVTAAARFAEFTEGRTEEPDLMGGFWAPSPYSGVQQTWLYPELRLVLDRYTIRTDTATRQFWDWTQCLSPDEVTVELAAAGFAPPTLYADVAGAPYVEGGVSFAVLTRRA